MRKQLTLIALIALCLLQITNVSGALLTVAEYPYGASDTSASATYNPTVPHPSASAATSAIYLTFQVTYNNTLLNSTDIYVAKTGTPVAYYRCSLYSTSGTYGSTAVPNILLENSLVDYSQAAFPAGGMFTAQFSQSTALYAGVTYALVIAEINETTSDNTNHIKFGADQVGSYGGNMGYYLSSAWNNYPTGTWDACFTVYGEGGDVVSFSGGNIYITQDITNQTVTANVTAEVTTGDVNVGGVTAEFNNTVINATGSAITAGDISAGAVTAGNVTASGGVTANFNNTSVTANGDITAGAVTAGDVTAAGAVTMAGDLSVNGTFENATLTYLTSTAVSGDANVYFLIAFIGLAVLLTFYNKVPLLNFLVGVVGISFIMLTIAKTDLPFWPYSSVLLALTSLVCMISGGFKLRNS